MRWMLIATTVAMFYLGDARAETLPLTGTIPRAEAESLISFAQVGSFADLDRLAQDTSERDFVPRPAVPESLSALSYNDYIKIRYKYKNATWWNGKSPFWIETFHQGFVQRDRVDLFVREDGINRWIPFSSDDFTYDIPGFDPSPINGAGHAGIKIAGVFPDTATQEMLTFLGSSYFRGRTEHSIYGSSARGLAVDIAINGDEEFPFYRAFWVDKPEPDDKSISVLALLDSPSVAGAYQFVLTPGTELTRIAVKSSLHFRRIPAKVGIAPLTSMWIWGDGLRGPPKDARPSVHDSDGLLIRTEGADETSDWTWRAYSRSPYPSVTSFQTDRLQGFGVMQRNTAFFHYDDHNAQYHRRPSVFVTPGGDWGAGRVELLEIPGQHEGIDNIGAFWIPQEPPSVAKPSRFEYTVDFFGGVHAAETNVAQATGFELDRKEDSIEMTIRFAGDAIAKITQSADIEIAVATIRGEVISKKVEKTETGDWLLKLDLKPSEPAPMELKATLRVSGKPVSETFAYLLPHKEPEFVYPDVYTR